MPSEVSIMFERLAHADREVVRMRVAASKGDFSGAIELWASAKAVGDVGEALKGFPSKVPDKYEYYFEGESQNLQIEVRTTDRAGTLLARGCAHRPG
jgi:hypothetical protein